MIDDPRNFSRRTILSVGAATLGLTAAGLRSVTAQNRGSMNVEGGVLKGFAILKGKPPKADEILISKDNSHCGEGVIVPDPVRTGRDGRLADVVVALKRALGGKAWPAGFKAPRIVQARCRFEPYVQIAAEGAELTILNRDPLLHNIHAYEIIGRARRTMFNIAQPSAGQIDRHELRLRRGHVVEVDCDAHNWMSAWIYTSDHPYVGIADSEVGYSIDGIPPGVHELIAWHPILGQVSREVEVAADRTVEFDIEFTTKNMAG